MSIQFLRGNILDSGCQVLVNPVNCIGPMGAGLAKQFARRFPGLEEDYRKHCISSFRMTPGGLYWWKRPDGGYWIANLATKDHWKSPSRLEWISKGLTDLAMNARHHHSGRSSIAIPPLGCGLGGLRWADVRRLIIQHMKDCGSLIEVYEP